MALLSAQSKETRNRILQIVQTRMGWTRIEAVIWSLSKNPKLGGRSPMDLIEEGKEKKLKTFVQEMKP